MSTSSKMERERAGRRAKAGSLSGLAGAGAGGGGVRRQRSLEWTGDRYSSSDEERPPQPPPLADRVFASLLAQATQQFDEEQRRMYGSQGGEELPRYAGSPQRQASPFPLESMNRRYYRRNRNSKGEEVFTAETSTLARRPRRDEFVPDARNGRHGIANGAATGSERSCDSPPEPAPPEVPPRGPSLHVTLRHRPAQPEPPTDADRLYLSEGISDTRIGNKPVDALQVGMKYILRWEDSWHETGLDALEQGRDAFINNKCEFNNCYVTQNQNYFEDPTKFHAVVMFGKHLESYRRLPRLRSPKQKFVFATMESAHYYPICRKQFDNYFNWTWTFRLDSDVKWGYLTVYDAEGRPVGPRGPGGTGGTGATAWRDTYDPLPDRVRKRLKSKHKAAAWFVSNCRSKNKREVLVEKLNQELQLFNMTVDIYGACSKDKNNKCERFDDDCYKKLERDYFFYLAFENSFDKDYVTEKVLTAFNNYVVPIVYGDANYSRFLPPGSYLNAGDYSVKDLVKIMRGIMSDETLYEDFFRWKNHYRLKLTSYNEDLCKMCALMNDNTKLETISVYENFRQWWNGKHACKS